MTHIEKMKEWLEVLEKSRMDFPANTQHRKAITSLSQAIAEAEGQEKALQALHNENERLGLYKDAYGKPEQCTYPNCPYPCMDLPDCIEQEPVAWVDVKDTHQGPYEFHGKELLPVGRHDLYTTPPAAQPAPVQEPVAYKPPAKWTDAEIEDGYRGIRWVTADGVYGRPSEEDVARYLGYTTPPAPQRTWVGLNEKELNDITCGMVKSWVMEQLARDIEAKLKQKNGYAEENT